MNKKECKPLFTIIGRMIESSEPLRAEYYKGYQRGIEVLVNGVSDAMADEHCSLIDYSIGGSGDPYIDSYARGYHDGFEGMKPEVPSLTSGFSKSLNIASIV